MMMAVHLWEKDRITEKDSATIYIVIKTSLYFGVQPVFIPISEPWRNGVVEHFNYTYNKKF